MLVIFPFVNWIVAHGSFAVLWHCTSGCSYARAAGHCTGRLCSAAGLTVDGCGDEMPPLEDRSSEEDDTLGLLVDSRNDSELDGASEDAHRSTLWTVCPFILGAPAANYALVEHQTWQARPLLAARQQWNTWHLCTILRTKGCFQPHCCRRAGY